MTGKYVSPINEDLHIALPGGTEMSAKYRLLYDAEFASNKSGAQLIETCVTAGESARIRAHWPLKVLHVDDKIALVALAETGLDGSLLVSSPHLLAALRNWFELLWNDDATTPVHGTGEVTLSASQRQVLRLLASGLSDETIARESGMSVRTVRRHLTAILEFSALPAGSRPEYWPRNAVGFEPQCQLVPDSFTTRHVSNGQGQLVSTSNRPLAGLVSDEAEQLYARLLEAGSLEIGSGSDQVDLDSAAAMELRDMKVAYRSPLTGDDFRPVPMPTALQMLLTSHHNEIIRRHELISAGWQRLDSLLSSLTQLGSTGTIQDNPLVEFVSGLDAVHGLSVELYDGARSELLGLSTLQFATPLAKDALVEPATHMIERGCRFRMIYDSNYAGDPIGRHIIDHSAAAGEEVRIRETLPLKMLHVDNKAALVALTDTGLQGSLLVRSPNLLNALREWFELLWNDPTSTHVGEPGQIALNAAQRNVLRLLASGMSDEAIARASGMSVRTVRRHISAVLDELRVTSRFAAGAAAAKRGWI